MFSAKAVFNRYHRLRKDGKGRIHIQVIFRRKTYYFDTEILVDPAQWMDGKVIRHRDRDEFNTDLEYLVHEFNKYYRACKRERRAFVPEVMFNEFYRVDTKEFTSFMFNCIMDEWEKSPRTTNAKREDALKRLKAFRPDGVYMTEINYFFLVSFQKWMEKQTKRKSKELLSDNYISSILGMVRKYVNEARKMGYIERDPFVGFRMKRTAKVIHVLTEEDIEEMEKAKIDPVYETIRDRFLFMCYTGMRYGDIRHITKENVDGPMLKYLAGKTARSKGKVARIPMDLFGDKLTNLMKKYKYAFGYYDNGEFNKRIKEVAKKTGIKFNVTAHVARHSFKSIMLERGYSIHIIAEMMGHSSIQTTERYGSISDRAILKGTG